MARLRLRWLLFAVTSACAAGELGSLLMLPDQPVHGGGLVGSALWTLVPVLAILVAIGFLAILSVLAILGNRQAFEKLSSGRVVVVCLLVLLHVYGSMELLQVALTDGHATGLHGLFGHGGWILVPIFVVITTTCIALAKTIDPLRRRASLTSFCGTIRPEGPTYPMLDSSWVASSFLRLTHLSGRAPPSLIV